ncbi:MAG: oxidoreductase [Gordonia sp. (in: high G+C Gram-positive bacteria)]|uniref:oxidoreductase n=1 Tax=Gordonia sp. (in: high G+C Gram-positive bacteria) TaxID=84139 RepID=UPI003C76AD8B
MNWSAIDMPAQEGRRYVVTGANAGIGAAMATRLVAAGAHVTLACRNLEKAAAVAEPLGKSATVAHLDLADLSSVREFADGIGEFDVLINNAGVMALPMTRTVDGFEMQMGTNHLGHFALTGLVLGKVRERVIVMSSLAQNLGQIRPDDLNWTTRRYNRWSAYGDSKLANMVFGRELARRLTAGGSHVTVGIAHPGYAMTDLMTGSDTPVDYLMRAGEKLKVGQSPDAGAMPALYAATMDVPTGSYWGPKWALRGAPSPARYRGVADDQSARDRLWAASEELTEVSFDL